MQASRIVQRRPPVASSDLCSVFCSLYITARGLSTSSIHRASGRSNNATPNPMHSAPPGTTKRDDKATTGMRSSASTPIITPNPLATLPLQQQLPKTLEQRAAENLERITSKTDEDQVVPIVGGLASDSIFAEPLVDEDTKDDPLFDAKIYSAVPLSQRNPYTMEPGLNPRPNARAQWARKMVIRDIRKRGRLTREMFLARTERTHTSQSRFFKTSVKKLAPLARQIAGKSIDEAIVQMRFSKKKVAKEVLNHLIQARNEAIVIRGMGLGDEGSPPQKLETVPRKSSDIREIIRAVVGDKSVDTQSAKQLLSEINKPAETRAAKPNANEEPVEITDPSNTAPLLFQRPDKSLLKGHERNPTDIYIAQAWVNRGKYGRELEPRARGRMYILRPPHTGVSIMLKEEKTRTREKSDKEIKAIRKRLNGTKLWTHLPDRAVSRQSQYVLW